MTDGTSQGLFIVVAIVIFGIFTVMAYILFEDTLSPALATMFLDATETAHERLNSQYTDERFFDFDKENGRIVDYRDFDLNDDIDLPSDVRIPKKIDGVDVTHIGGRAFDNKGLTSVIIPDTVTHIEDGNNPLGPDYWGAFSKNKLTKVVLPNRLQYLGYGAFWTNKLTYLEIPETIKTTGHTVMAGNSFKHFTIPNHITEIGSYTFWEAPLEKVIIPEGVEKIGQSVFYGTKLTELSIPYSVNKIGNGLLTNSSVKVVNLPIHLKTLVESDLHYLKLDENLTQPKTINYLDENGNIVETVKN